MNKSKYISALLTLFAVCGISTSAVAQSFTADKVVAVVGNSAILYSDVVKQADEILIERREMNYTPDRSAENAQPLRISVQWLIVAFLFLINNSCDNTQ